MGLFVFWWVGSQPDPEAILMALLEWPSGDAGPTKQKFAIALGLATVFGLILLFGVLMERWGEQEAREIAEEQARRYQERYREQTEVEEKRRQALGSMTLEQIDALGGIGFEKWLAERLELAGFAVRTTPASGDFGLDLIVRIGSARLGVQAKCWQAPVGNEAVQAVIAGCEYFGCDVGAVVTNSRFTKAAVAQARRCRLKVVLIDRDQLADVPALLRVAAADDGSGTAPAGGET